MDRPRRRHARLALPAVLLVAGLLTPAAATAATDTDHDGLPNTWERSYSLTSPSRADTDRDGLADGREDPDRDGLTNRQEYVARMHPRRADTDRDGIRDGREDTDGDGLRTAFEFRAGTSPRRADSDGDGKRDGRESPDRDGLTNTSEQRLGTNPRVADTDRRRLVRRRRVPGRHGPAQGLEPPARHDRPATDPHADADPDPDADAATGSAPTVPGAPGCPIFPANNVWNVPIDGRSVAANSATMIAAIGLDRGLHMDFGSYAGYGIPYQVVTASTPRSTVTFDYDEDSDHVGYPIPASPLIEGGSDRHILMVDKDACRLYELFAARQVGSAWTAGSGATWDLRSNALRPETLDQRRCRRAADPARARPLRRGRRRRDPHALRFTTNRTRTQLHLPGPPPGRRIGLDVAPADGPARPAQGRLRHQPVCRRTARAIAEALKRYGMILADNGSPWYIIGRQRPALRRRRACTSSTSSPAATSRSSTRPGWSTGPDPARRSRRA